MMDSSNDQLQMQIVDPLQGRRFLVRKRDGRIEEFNEARILLAIESAFKAHLGLNPISPLPTPVQAVVKKCADKVVERVLGRAVRGEDLEVERIQDTVEEQLMLAGHLEVARRYILYREQRRLARAEREGRARPPAGSPAGGLASASPVLWSIYSQALPEPREGENFEAVYRRHFDGYLNEGDYWRLLTPELLEFDPDVLARGLRPERDRPFTAGQLETLRESYLLRQNGRCLETPQYFWMRIAMGLALNEDERREERALGFYEALSTFRFIPSDLILRHAGTPQPALIHGFKDAAMLRSPQPDDQPAACPLGAINLAAHVSANGCELDAPLLRATVALAVRMLDNAVDLSLYPSDSDRADGLGHRAIGLGMAGFSRALARLHLKERSAAAADFADGSMELLSFCAIQASAQLARERGPYPRYAGSTWDCGILPLDTFWRQAQERGLHADAPAAMFQDWTSARDAIRRHGMRNSALTALSPLDAPAGIAGICPSGHGGEAGAQWWIQCAARQQKWVDLGQTLVLPAPERDAGPIAAFYMQAWENGLQLRPSRARRRRWPRPPKNRRKPASWLDLGQRLFPFQQRGVGIIEAAVDRVRRQVAQILLMQFAQRRHQRRVSPVRPAA